MPAAQWGPVSGATRTPMAWRRHGCSWSGCTAQLPRRGVRLRSWRRGARRPAPRTQGRPRHDVMGACGWPRRAGSRGAQVCPGVARPASGSCAIPWVRTSRCSGAPHGVGRMHARRHVCARAHAHPHVCVQTCVRARASAPACPRACAGVCVCARAHTHMCVCAHTAAWRTQECARPRARTPQHTHAWRIAAHYHYTIDIHATVLSRSRITTRSRVNTHTHT